MPSPSYLRVTKSETRDLADHQVREHRRTEVDDLPMTNRSFFAAFVVIAAVLTVIALIVR